MSNSKVGSAQWAEWYDSKCINFLNFIQYFIERVSTDLKITGDPIIDYLGKRSKSLAENPQERAILFSALARKQIVSTGVH